MGPRGPTLALVVHRGSRYSCEQLHAKSGCFGVSLLYYIAPKLWTAQGSDTNISSVPVTAHRCDQELCELDVDRAVQKFPIVSCWCLLHVGTVELKLQYRIEFACSTCTL